jgi:hypothetical protein
LLAMTVSNGSMDIQNPTQTVGATGLAFHFARDGGLTDPPSSRASSLLQASTGYSRRGRIFFLDGIYRKTGTKPASASDLRVIKCIFTLL